MRPLKRIPEILDLLNQIWQLNQDMRFFQLVYVLQSSFDHEIGGNGAVKKTDQYGAVTKIGYDLFNVEDDKFIVFLKKELEKRKVS